MGWQGTSANICAQSSAGNTNFAMHGFAANLMRYALLALCLVLVQSQAAHAYGDEAYIVQDLTVERIAENAVSAKKTAMEAVYGEALANLFRRLTRAKDRSRLPEPTQARAEPLVASLSILHEESGPTRYAVTARVRFEPRAIAHIFRRAGVRVYDKPGPKALLIPIHVSADEDKLFGDSAAWESALTKAAATPWLIKLAVAKGSQEDRLEPVERLRALDRVSLDYLRVRHAAQGAMIAEFRDATAQSPATLRLAGDTGAGPFDQTILIAPDIDDPLGYAAAQIPDLLDDHWKQVQSHGASAGVRINGVPINPVALEHGELPDTPADPQAVMAELRLVSTAGVANVHTSAATPPDRVVSPVRTASTARPGRLDNKVSMSLASHTDVVALRLALAKVHEIRAFEITGDDAAFALTLWYWSDRQAAFSGLQAAGFRVERDLATTGWRLTK